MKPLLIFHIKKIWKCSASFNSIFLHLSQTDYPLLTPLDSNRTGNSFPFFFSAPLKTETEIFFHLTFLVSSGRWGAERLEIIVDGWWWLGWVWLAYKSSGEKTMVYTPLTCISSIQARVWHSPVKFSSYNLFIDFLTAVTIIFRHPMLVLVSLGKIPC